jgi:hypothetical protein
MADSPKQEIKQFSPAIGIGSLLRPVLITGDLAYYYSISCL